MWVRDPFVAGGRVRLQGHDAQRILMIRCAQAIEHQLNLEPAEPYVLEHNRRGRDHELAFAAAILDFVELLLGLKQLLVELPQRWGWFRLVPDDPLAASRFRTQLLHGVTQVPENLLAGQVPAALPAE